MKEFWNERYSQEAFAFGEKPNEYFKEQILKWQPGSILFPAEGEGRNAVYAAQLGWNVSAFDISEEGKNKAKKLSEKHQVNIDYLVGELTDLNYKEQQFDAIVLIYAHFPSSIRSMYHKRFTNLLKKDGIVILEAFSKKHIDYNSKNEKVGGPKDVTMLYSIDEIKTDFVDFEILELIETEIELNEGLYHIGLGSIVRFIGRKK
ncbi:MAG: class I SAM-dependent methyltransferase [Bacteroidia bacterium]